MFQVMRFTGTYLIHSQRDRGVWPRAKKDSSGYEVDGEKAHININFLAHPPSNPTHFEQCSSSCAESVAVYGLAPIPILRPEVRM